MHGIIYAELKNYVTSKLGAQSWNRVLTESGIGPKIYLSNQAYPDEDVFALVTTASKITGYAVQSILEEFGEFIAPSLLSIYKPLVKSHWKTLDLIDNTERTIHTVVRAKNPGAKPPELKTSRPGENEVMITYTSPRKLCSVSKGIVRGLGRHYQEQIMISETECMHTGGSACRISVRKV